jgi:hypothetical protein
MAIRLTLAERRAVKAGGGAAVLPLANLAVQPKATYFNKYGDAFVLPGDPWSMTHYLSRGLMLSRPEKPEKRQEPGVGVADWDGVTKEGAQEAGTADPPTATYYTADGTPVPGLPADPASIRAYRAEGLTLSPPNRSETTAPARPGRKAG